MLEVIFQKGQGKLHWIKPEMISCFSSVAYIDFQE
jgi:hypothetical protein